MMHTIPEDSVLRRHYLAAANRQQQAASRPAASASQSSVRSGMTGSAETQQTGGIFGFIKRLFGAQT